jgi:transcriptional regulator with XRE-family HTH domain
MRGVGSRERAVDVGAARGRALTAQVLSDIRSARLDRNLTEADLARTLRISQPQLSRIERGLTGGISIEQASVLLAAVGMELSVRAYPSGEPLRDAAHAALIGRLRPHVHTSLRMSTEVAFPAPGDRRAWDVVIIGSDWRHGFEAETRPRDLQALERRISLKSRDGDVDAVSLVLLDSRHNRAFVRAHTEVLTARFPVPARRALELLRAGVNPGAGSVILL